MNKYLKLLLVTAIISLVGFYSYGVGKPLGSALELRKYQSREFGLFTAYIDTYYKTQGKAVSGYGSGVLFYSYIERSNKVIVVTAGHVIQPKELNGQLVDSVGITYRMYKAGDSLKTTKTWVTSILNIDTLKNTYRIPKTDLIAIFMTPIAPEDSGYAIATLSRSDCINFEDLLQGFSTISIGYPLGLLTSGLDPVFRSGKIAGYDPTNKEILIEGFAIRGMSGCPVYLDGDDDAVAEYAATQTSRRLFIGITVSFSNERYPYPVKQDTPKKKKKKEPPSYVEVDQNIGLARVLPANTLMKLLDDIIETQKTNDTTSESRIIVR